MIKADGGKGSWNLRNTAFVQPAGAKWAMVICVGEQQMQGNAIGDFIQNLKRVARERGMELHDPVGNDPIYAYETIQKGSARPKDGLLETFLTNEVQRLERENGLSAGGIGLLLAVMGDTKGENGKYLYPTLKRWSHTVSGLPVQCCQVKKALHNGPRGTGKMASDPQYVAGLLLKMNLKLGGENCCTLYRPLIHRTLPWRLHIHTHRMSRLPSSHGLWLGVCWSRRDQPRARRAV